MRMSFESTHNNVFSSTCLPRTGITARLYIHPRPKAPNCPTDAECLIMNRVMKNGKRGLYVQESQHSAETLVAFLRAGYPNISLLAVTTSLVLAAFYYTRPGCCRRSYHVHPSLCQCDDDGGASWSASRHCTGYLVYLFQKSGRKQSNKNCFVTCLVSRKQRTGMVRAIFDALFWNG